MNLWFVSVNNLFSSMSQKLIKSNQKRMTEQLFKRVNFLVNMHTQIDNLFNRISVKIYLVACE